MNREEWRQVLEKLHSVCFAWALTCCTGDRKEAKDVLQTTYLKILDGRARFDGASSVRTWLFAVIRRTSAGRRRGAAMRRLLLARWARLQPAAPVGHDAEALAAESERAARLREALGVLSSRQRQVLDLVFYHDLSIQEAASVMGLGVGTARVHYERGKKAILKHLQREEKR